MNYFKIAKIPPTIKPPTTRKIILLAENTESVYLLQNLSISNKGLFNSLSFWINKKIKQNMWVQIEVQIN